MPLHSGPKIGDLLPEVVRTYTEESVAAYAAVSGAVGEMHTDPEFARSLGFRGVVVHGQMNLALVSRALTETYGPGWASGGTLTGRYLKPVVAGDTVRVQLRVTERGEASVDHTVEVLNQDDELVLVGQARAALREALPDAVVAPDAPPPDASPFDFPERRVGYADMEPGLTGRVCMESVTETLVRDFASAVDDLNSIYFDDAAAGQAGFGGRIAPLLIVGFMNPLYASLKSVVGDTWPEERVHAQATFEFAYPPRAGDKLLTVAEIAGREEKRGRNRVTFRCKTYNLRGVLIATALHTEVWL